MSTRSESSMVKHPPHYNNHPSGVECWEITDYMNFNIGNAFKYVYRHEFKTGMVDLQKAQSYIDRELELERGLPWTHTLTNLTSEVARKLNLIYGAEVDTTLAEYYRLLGQYAFFVGEKHSAMNCLVWASTALDNYIRFRIAQSEGFDACSDT